MASRVLVINAGSSSVKFCLFSMASEKALTRGIVERIGLPQPRLKYEARGRSEDRGVDVADHRGAMREIAAHLESVAEGGGPLADAVGHRVVHGGEHFAQPVLIDEKVKRVIQDCFELAPLHNPVNYKGIVACEEFFPGVPQVAVFDTAFHQTIPERAFLYGLPYDYYTQHRIRRYGFHGTSHRYVAMEAASLLGRPFESLRMITCHLGNGCSVTAVAGGKSVETSMGFTPLEGPMMGTRSGDIDPAVVTYLQRKLGLAVEEVDALLNKQSGLLGLSGRSNDMRDVIEAADGGDRRSRLAVEVFVHRLRKYVGAYFAVLNGIDALVFTAGIGENSSRIREQVCGNMESLGIELDAKRNASNQAIISADSSQVKVLVIPTDEEAMIARDTALVVQRMSSRSR